MTDVVSHPRESVPSEAISSVETDRPGFLAPVLTGAAIVVVPLALFALLRPDWYYLQNGLDPYFYTGYVQNFDDALRIGGVKHYFVSRWSLYLPQVYLVSAFGAVGGYMVFRAALAIIVVMSLFLLGRRWWSTATTWLLIVATLCSPLLLRPLFSDYPDAVFVSLGIALIALVALHPASAVSGTLAGIAAALCVVANPTAATIVLTTMVSWLVVARGTWRARVRFLGPFALGGLAVLGGSIAWFGGRYGMADVYQPTIDYMRQEADSASDHRAKRLLWLGYYLWIYIPLVILAVAVVLRRFRGWRPSTGERIILWTCALQCAFQFWYQFARTGDTLDVIYYWHYMVPSLLLASAVVVGRLMKGIDERIIWAITGIIVAVLLVAPSPFPSAKSWIDVVIVAGVAAYVAWRFRDRAPYLAPALLVMVPIFVPLTAPNPLPLLPGEQYVPASYDEVFHSTDSAGQDAFDAESWWITQSNAFGDDVERNVHYWIGGGHGHRLAAASLAHAAGRWLNAGWSPPPGEELSLPDPIWAELAACQVPHVALVGTPEDVDGMLERLDEKGIAYRSVFDSMAPSRTPTRANLVEIGPCPTN